MRATAMRVRKEKFVVDSTTIADSREAAEEAGLRYVSDDQPGYTRKAKGDRFEYFDSDGKRIRDEQRILRISRLAIPPAYIDVWICPSPNGHLQATGRDARRRKQYRYHERWRAERDENKYERMLLFARTLPKIRRRVRKDMASPGLSREKVLATVVQLLERTFIRVGNEEYARENKSFGLTTMRDRHVEVKGATVHFSFRGKGGINHEIPIEDHRIARIVRKLADLPGQELFQYLDDAGARHDVTSQDVNDYLEEISGQNFTAKDFRTWAGTVHAAMRLNAQEPFKNKAQAKKNINTAIGAVATMLGHTPTICRKCYVHPAVLETYLEGKLIEGLRRKNERVLSKRKMDVLRSDEVAVLSFLLDRLEKAK